MPGQYLIQKGLSDYYNTSQAYMEVMRRHSTDYFQSYIKLVSIFMQRLKATSPTFIELGCASGVSTYAIASRFQHAKCYGVDISVDNIHYANAQFRSDNLAYHAGDCMQLALRDRSFSVVASCDLIEHLPDTEAALAEMSRLVEDDGYIILKCPNHRNPVIPLSDFVRLRYRYPFTKSWLQNIGRFSELTRDLLKKIRTSEIMFRMRTPDLSDEKAVGDDADAVYEASPLDLIRYFKKRGFRIVNIAWPRRDSRLGYFYSRWFPLFSSGGQVLDQFLCISLGKQIPNQANDDRYPQQGPRQASQRFHGPYW